ncbi:MAG: DUF4912 domain-containing protein [Blastocatellia bacterium]
MFILRPSSPIRPIRRMPGEPKEALSTDVTEKVKVVPAQEPTGEPYIDEGLPVPDSYDVDIIRAMLQDPFRIFIYWEVREESLKALTRYFSEKDAAGFKTALKLIEIEGGNEAFFDVGRQGRYWMMVLPDREYEFEIGVRSPAHGYVPLVRSNRVRTPRGTVSPEPDYDHEYKLTPPEFMNVLEATGFAAEASLEITVRAMPGTSPEIDQFSEALLKLPEEVREAVRIAGAGKELTPEIIEALPDPLRGELQKLFDGSDGRVASVGLMHYLPEILREAIEDDSELISDHVHPLHVAPRFFVGGTENVAWPDTEIRVPGLPRSLSSVASGQWSVFRMK